MTKNHNKAFGIVLRELRKSRQKTQENLGLDAGLARNTISLLELGHRSPTLDTIEILCAVLDISLTDFARLIDLEMGRTHDE